MNWFNLVRNGLLSRPLNGRCRGKRSQGFTLLEVLVALTILSVGCALALTLISGTLGNIRKVQLRARAIQHAREVMETALLDKNIQNPTSFSGGFEDGSRWSVRVEEYAMPALQQAPGRDLPQNIPVKLLSYTVEMFGPDSRAPDCRLHTLKLVKKSSERPEAGE